MSDRSREELARVLYNLASNAADAMPNGGALTVRTEKSHGKILIIFSDTGTGIPDAIKAKVLEPSAFGFSGLFLSSCKKKSFEGTIVFTLLKAEDITSAAAESKVQKFQSEIAAVTPDKPGLQPVVLTKEFYSARSPEISMTVTKCYFLPGKNKVMYGRYGKWT